MRPIIYALGGALIGGIGGAALFDLVPNQPPVKSHVTDEDVRHYLDQRDGLEAGRQFRGYFYSHEDTPAPRIEFPEIVADQQMWDWTLHALLRHDHLVKSWSSDSVSWVSSSSTITTAPIMTWTAGPTVVTLSSNTATMPVCVVAQ